MFLKVLNFNFFTLGRRQLPGRNTLQSRSLDHPGVGGGHTLETVVEAGRGVRKLPAQPGAPGVPGMGIAPGGGVVPGMGVAGRGGQTTNYQNGRGPSRLGSLMNSFNITAQQSNNSNNINTGVGNNPNSLPPMATGVGVPMGGPASMQTGGQPQSGNMGGPMGPNTAQQPPPGQHPMDTYAQVGPTPVNGYLPNTADGSQTTYQPSQTMTPSVYQNGQTPYQNGHTPYQNGQGPYHTPNNYQNGGPAGQTNYQNGSLPYQQQQQIPYQQQQPEWT